ncbi:MAG TPA: tetratricopeptide repeat protein [Burkholderiales bacterium]|nr:tetratricopeptide repeat protein [Burkholderiales bacterium]
MRRSVLTAALLFAGALTGLQASAAKAPERLPNEALTEPILYELLIGEIAVQRGEPELAAKTYIDLAKRTRDPRIARRAVEIANYARMPELALEAAKLWHEAEPDSVAALQMVTVYMAAVGRVDEAEPYLKKLLSSSETKPENVFMQLNRLLAADPDKAANLRLARKLAAGYPDLPNAHFAVAQAAAAANDDQLALREIRRAAELRPDWAVAAGFEAEILQRKSPAQAAERLARYLDKYPEQNDVRMSYARLLVGEKRYAEARKQFEKLLAANPDSTEIIYAVGLLAFQLKDYATAEASMKRLLALDYRDPDGARYILGQIEEAQKRWPQAIAWYEQIQNGDHFLASRLRVAQAMAQQGKLDAARAYLHALKVNGKQDEVQLVIAEAQLLRDANDAAGAFALLDRALAQSPDQPELLYDQALTAEKLGRYEVLEQSLRKVIKLQPDNAQAYNALGYSLADRDVRLPEARKLIEKALELRPDDGFIIDSMGWVLFRQGDLVAAETHLRRAYGDQQDAEIGAHLGEVLWVEGKRDEARRIWDQALKDHPENETLRKTVRRFSP